MKALSLWQPWATLVALGEKQYETRSWKTSHRGLLAIHAAKRMATAEKELCLDEPFASSLLVNTPKPVELPLGYVVCVVRVLDIFPTTYVEVSEKEKAFGDYAPGRFAWRLELVEAIAPLYTRGYQGLFDLPANLMTKYR